MEKDTEGKEDKQPYTNAAINTWLKSPLNEAERKLVEEFINTNEAIQSFDYNQQNSFWDAQDLVIEYLQTKDPRYFYLFSQKQNRQHRRVPSIQSNIATALNLDDDQWKCVSTDPNSQGNSQDAQDSTDGTK